MTDAEIQERARAILEEDYREAHKHSIFHRAEVEASDVCACFYCGAGFPPSEIREWVDDGSTALCPKCRIDSVLGLKCGYEIDAPVFLQGMYDYWFLAKKTPRSG